MIKKRVFSIIISIVKPIIVVLISCIVIILYVGISYFYTRTKIILMIKNDSAVSDAEILFDKGVFISEFAIRILFNNSGNLEIHGVNGKGKGPIHIYEINDHFLSITNKNGEYIGRERELELWSNIIGVQLESVTDILKNYYLISEHMENWTDLSKYRTYNDEYFYLVRNRIIEEHLYLNSILFDEQKYFLLKYPVLMRWRSPAWPKWQEDLDFTYPIKLDIGENCE